MMIVAAAAALIVLAIVIALLLGIAISEGREREGAEEKSTVKGVIGEQKMEETAPVSPGISPAADTGTDAAGNISLPGYETITFRALEKRQALKLYNPASNPCYFLISIVMPDGREVYRSKMIRPGEKFTEIELTETLEAGTYQDARLQYTCFDLNDLHTATGANIKFTLEVIP